MISEPRAMKGVHDIRKAIAEETKHLSPSAAGSRDLPGMRRIIGFGLYPAGRCQAGQNELPLVFFQISFKTFLQYL